MKKLNVNRLKMQIEKHFSYFNNYKQFEYLQSLDESTDDLKYSFSESHIKFLYKLDEKNYNYEERKTIGHLEKLAFSEFFEIASSCNSLYYRELQHRIFKVTSKSCSF